MKLHSVIISYHRWDLTERAIWSYRETVTLPHTIWVVDNGSDPKTQQRLRHKAAEDVIDGLILFPENVYPGRAANTAWINAPDDATHLHRADNDFIFLPGWCEEVERCFAANDRLGQLGCAPTRRS